MDCNPYVAPLYGLHIDGSAVAWIEKNEVCSILMCYLQSRWALKSVLLILDMKFRLGNDGIKSIEIKFQEKALLKKLNLRNYHIKV